MHDARDARTLLGYRKLLGERSYRQSAAGRTDDRLRVPASAQAARQRQQRFLAAAPVAGRVDMDDR
jgi:hypothetical protein